jgi:hypothetical protein
MNDLQTYNLPDRTNTRFAPEIYKDNFDQMSISLSGSITDDIDVVLTTSIFERDTEYTYDYSSYVEYYSYAAYSYYVCNYYEYYGYYYIDINDCRDPRMTYAQSNDIERTATEIRVSSDNDSGFNWVLGAFQETMKKLQMLIIFNLEVHMLQVELQEHGGKLILIEKEKYKLFLVKHI